MHSLVERGSQTERWENERAIGAVNALVPFLFFPFFFRASVMALLLLPRFLVARALARSLARSLASHLATLNLLRK